MQISFSAFLSSLNTLTSI